MSDLTRSTINSISRQPGVPVRPMAGPPGGGQMGQGMTPKEIMGIFRRHVMLIILCTIIGFVVGGVSWFLCLRYIPKYTAVGFVRVETPGRQDPTQIATRTANKDTLYQSRVSKAALMRQDSLYEQLLKDDDIKDTKWYKKLGSNPLVEGIRILKDDFRASPQRESQYISVSMRAGSKDECVLIVEKMIRYFINSQSEISKGDIQGKLRNLSTQETIARRGLNSSNATLDEIRVASGYTGIDSTSSEFDHTFNKKENQAVLELDNLETQVSQLEEEILTYQRRVDSVGVDIVTQSQTEQDSIVISLKQQEVSLKALLDEKQVNLGENHRTVREIRERIAQIVQQREERYSEIAKINSEAVLANANDQKRHLLKRRETLQTKQKEAAELLKGLDNARSQYKIAVQIRDQNQDKLDGILVQTEKFRTMLEDPETPKVHSAGRVQKPIEPSFPKWQMFFPGGFVLGCMLGAGLAFLMELLNDKLRTPKDIVSGLRINLLGMICHSDEDSDIKNVSNICRVISDAPYSITSELYRQVRTNLRKSLDKQGDKVVLVTSVAGSAGKTTTASNLAVALAAEGKKVVFLDANFRRPSSVLNFPKVASDMPGMTRHAVGLSDYLKGDTELSEIVRQCSVTNVNVVDCGAMPVHPSEMLNDYKMDELTKQFSVSYDYVIIDGPPMIVADAKVLAIKADACLVVFNAANTRKGAAQRVIRELNEINANLVGCTLVGVKSMKGGYFDEMFRRYKDYQKVKIAGAVS